MEDSPYPPNLHRCPGVTTRWLILITVVMVGVLTLIWAVQRQLIYFPTHELVDPPAELEDIEEATLSTEDGLDLTAWFVAHEIPSEGTVVVFNGNAGNRSHRVPLAQAQSRRGYGVLLVDYRGYGGNPGSPSELGLAADARAADAYLERREDVDPDRVVYFGESLGAAVAVGLALEHPPAALILRSPFTSLADIASVHYPFLPAGLLLRDDYPSRERVESVDIPMLVVAGSADRIVPLDQSADLYEAASEPKRMVVIEGAGHNDLALLAGDEMIEEIVTFLQIHLTR